MRQDGEPSVDQLLQSIKKVMARESRLAPPPFPESTPVQSAGEELPPVPDPPPEPADREEAADLRALTAAGLPDGNDAPFAADELAPDFTRSERTDADGLIEDEADAESEPPPADPAAEWAPSADASLEPDPLLNAEATAQLRRSFAAIAAVADPHASDSPGLAEAASLELTVREMLRPMIAQWLEAHLPEMVERELKSELARLRSERAA